MPEGWGVRDAIDRAFAGAGIRRAAPFEVGDIASSVDFVRHGLGVAVMPPSTTAGDDGLVRVPIRHHAPEFVFSIASPTTRPLGAAALALLALARPLRAEATADGSSGSRRSDRRIARMTDPVPSFASPDGLIAPAGYSHVVSIPSGRLVWTSGQVPIDLDGVVPADWDGQARLAFANVGHALRALGADWPDVVKLTYYVVDREGLLAIRAVRDELVDTEPAADELARAGRRPLPARSQARDRGGRVASVTIPIRGNAFPPASSYGRVQMPDTPTPERRARSWLPGDPRCRPARVAQRRPVREPREHRGRVLRATRAGVPHPPRDLRALGRGRRAERDRALGLEAGRLAGRPPRSYRRKR